MQENLSTQKVEEQPCSDPKVVKKKIDFKQFIAKGNLIDAKDTLSNWCVATIIEVCNTDDTIRVRFDGWSSHWNEWYKFTSSRIAPFRKYSKGYTAQAKKAVRDWNFSNEEIEKFKELISKSIENDFQDMNVFNITQIFRGTYYIFLDNLLCNSPEFKNSEYTAMILNTFKDHLGLTVHFLKKLPLFYNDFQKNLTNPDAFLIEESVALAHCFYEISESATKIFGVGERLHKFYKDNYQNIIALPELHNFDKKWVFTEEMTEKTEPESFWLRNQHIEKCFKYIISYLVEHFGEIGGITEILSLLNIEENKPLIPIKYLDMLFKLVLSFLEYTKEELRAKLLKALKDAILKRFNSLTDKEIKDFDKDFASNFINETKTLFLQHFPEETIHQLVETLELELALKYLKSSFFEKRIKGVNEIKEICERIEYSQNYSSHDNYYYQISRRRSMKYLTSEIFLKWLSDNQVVEIILGDSMHVEIVKRCHDIIIFMCKHKYMPPGIINHIWQAGEGKHDSLVRVLYEMIIEISAYLSADSLKLLYEKIKQIPLSDYVELTLNLVKGFTENVIRINILNLKYSSKSEAFDEKNVEEQYLGVELLWKVILDNSSLANNLIEMAISHIKSIIYQMNTGILRTYFMTKALEEIRNGRSIPQSLSVGIHILHYYIKQRDLDSYFKKIQPGISGHNNLIDIVVKDLKRYQENVKNKLNENKNPINYLENVFEGKFSHKFNLERRLKMLEALVKMSQEFKEPAFTNEHLTELWNIFIKAANNDHDKRIYCAWLMSKNEENLSEINIILPSKSHILFQFNNILCDRQQTDFFNLCEEEFECFIYLFKIVNFYENKIKLMKNGKFYVVDIELSGKNDLWDIFLNTSSPQIIEGSINLLVNMHLQFATNVEKKKKKEIQDNFTIKCIKLLKQSFTNQNFALLNKAISLIMNFFEKFEGKSGSYKDSAQRQSNNMSVHLITVTVLLKPEEIKKDIKVNYLETLGSFRRKISEEFKISINQFTFSNKINQSDLNDFNDDDNLLRDMCWSNLYVINRKNKTEENSELIYHPKKLISDSPEYLDLLFMLLSSPNSGCLNVIWELLMMLPVNEKIKEGLVKLEKKWEELFDENSLYKSLYCLQIIEELSFSEEINQNSDWRKKMKSSNALQFFLDVYTKQSFENYSNLISKKYIASLLKIINHYTDSWKLPENYIENSEKLKRLCYKLLETLSKISDYTLYREKNNLENCQYEKNSYISRLNEKKLSPEEVKPPDFFILESEIAYLSLELLLNLFEQNPELLELVYNYQHLEDTLLVSLIKSDNVFLKKKMKEGLINLFEESNKWISTNNGNNNNKTNNSLANKMITPQEFFLPMFLKNFFPIALKESEQSEIFFELLQKNILLVSPNKLVFSNKIKGIEVNIEEILNSLIEIIKKETFYERNHDDKDNILVGVLKLLSSLLKQMPQKIVEIGQNQGLLQEILGPCLFETPRKSIKNDIFPKCKGVASRAAAFELLGVLASECPSHVKVMLDYLKPMLLQAEWRTKSFGDWNIVPKINEKSSTGYVGLKNLGCICYMNSLMQQFYMIPSFRQAVLDVEDRNYNKVPKQDNLLYQLKCLFLALNESEKQYYNPKNFCQAFKDWDGNPTNVYEQRDVDEFFNMFLDRLENAIKGTANENFIKKHFGGVLSNELICKGCPHYSEREESFLAISLQVKNKKTIQESLQSFVEGEMLEGDNAYLCEQCNKKVPTLKRVCLKKLPNHMILVLKRFEFDFDTMTKVKVNDSCEFPMTINFENYTQQGLRKQERKKNKEKGQENNDFDENLDLYDQSYFEYRLKGIVIHLGIADSGHYYSLIQERGEGKNEWYEFNDIYVKTFDEKDIPDEAFGGEEKWSYYSMSNMKEKIKNAYILFYERIIPTKEEELPNTNLTKEESKDTEIEEKASADNKAQRKPSSQQKIEASHPDLYQEEFLQEILRDNLKFHVHKSIFSNEYFSFVVQLVNDWKFEENSDYIEPPFLYNEKQEPSKFFNLEILKFGVLFFLTCMIREKEKQHLAGFLPELKKALAGNLPCCLWLLSAFSNKKIIEEFILNCVEKNVRELIVGLLTISMKRVYTEEAQGAKNRLFETDSNDNPTTILANFINSFFNLLYELRGNYRDFTEFFLIYYEFSKLGPESAHYLIKKKTIGRFIEFVCGNFRDLQEVFHKLTDVKSQEFTQNQMYLGEPSEIKKKNLTNFEELRQRKKEKAMAEYSTSSKIYLWQAVCELLFYCKLNTKTDKICKWQRPGPPCELLPEERLLLRQEGDIIERIWNDTKTKGAVRAISSIYTFLTFEDEKFMEALIGPLRKGLMEKNSNDYRFFFAFIKKMLALEDSIQSLRTEKIMLCYYSCMQGNYKFYNEYVCLQDFLLKIAGRYPKVRAYLAKNSEICNWIMEYIRNNELGSGLSQQYIKSRMERCLPYNRFPTLRNFQEYKEYCEKKLAKFKKIVKNELEHENVDWDSDDDLSNHEFKRDEKLDYFYQNLGKWITAQVKMIVEEMINLKLIYNDTVFNTSIWVSRRSENLAPYMSMQDATALNTEKKQEDDRNKGRKDENNMNIP